MKKVQICQNAPTPLILKYEVIYDALKVISNTKFRRSREFGDIGSFGDMNTTRIYTENRQIA
jgi:hypothetical protein